MLNFFKTSKPAVPAGPGGRAAKCRQQLREIKSRPTHRIPSETEAEQLARLDAIHDVLTEILAVLEASQG